MQLAVTLKVHVCVKRRARLQLKLKKKHSSSIAYGKAVVLLILKVRSLHT